MVPDIFHPSSFAALETCPLSVLGLSATDNDALLASNPAAYLGKILHHVRHELNEGRWNGVSDPGDAADLLFSLSLTQAEAELREDSHTAELLPLRRSVGRRRWKTRISALRTWARSLVADVTDAAPRHLILRENAPQFTVSCAEPPSMLLGSERAAFNSDLRLRGKPDWSGERGPGQIEIVDYKSGHIRDPNGQLIDAHVIQLQLYALMVEAAFPMATVTLYLEQTTRVHVPWGPLERAQAVDVTGRAKLQRCGRRKWQGLGS